MLDQVLPAVEAALAPHGTRAATVRVSRDNGGLWEVDVEPNSAGAARLTIVGAEREDDDEITLTFGETRVYIWGEPEEVASWVHQYAEAVFAGRFEEAGARGDSRARIRLASGELRTIGSVGLPVSWSRKRRKYSPYS